MTIACACLRLRACACACVCLRVRAFARACVVFARGCVCMCVCTCVYVCVRAFCACVRLRVCACVRASTLHLKDSGRKCGDRRGISQDTKLKVYMAVVLTVLLYACESWTVYSRHARKLNHFHTKCLRIILSIKWQDMVPDTEMLTRAGIPSIHTLLQKTEVRWAGLVALMSDDRLPKQLLYGELCYDKRSVGGQKKRSKDTLKNTITSFNIDVTNWEVCAQDRPLWRSMIHTGARTAETNKDRGGSEKSALLAKQDFTLTPAPQPARHTHAPECGIVLQARIGLISHLRTHRVNQT